MSGVVGLKRLFGRLLFTGALTLFAGGLVTSVSQDKTEKGEANAEAIAKGCNPKIVRKAESKHKAIKFREGEKLKNHPLVAFQIGESGEVISATVKRSSGVRDYDDAALSFVHSAKYNSRPGCPTIDSEAGVIIDFR